MDSASIQAMIENGLPGAQVEVSGADGVHFEATVVACQFAGKLPLARHRQVYATLGELMGGAIHALALKTLTPEEAGKRESGMAETAIPALVLPLSDSPFPILHSRYLWPRS